MEKIVLASNNKHKIKEIKDMLEGYEILSLNDIGYYDDIVEDGETFEENSLIKSQTIHEYLKEQGLEYIVIADDTGLCVNSLDGAPGVYSARYAGNHDDVENRKKLQKELEGKEDRSAYFVCNVSIVYPDGSYKNFVGKTFGTITKDERGKTDFGYDCIFLSDDLNKTFGEASEEEKNSVSHRSRAIMQLAEELKK
jgi:XTP/dITP diphosphohydrolase